MRCASTVRILALPINAVPPKVSVAEIDIKSLGLFEQLWIDADRTQVCIAHVRAVAQGVQHGLEEVHGDRIAIAHGGFRCLC